MTDPDPTADQEHRAKTAKASALFVFALVITGGIVPFITPVGVGAAAGNNVSDKAPYYDNQSNVSNPDPGWFNGGDVTLDGLIDMVLRVPGYIIGTGPKDQSGVGFVGTLLMGIIISAGALGMIMGTGIGAIGAMVVAVLVGFGLTMLGFAPGFVRVLMLFAIGIIAATALRRALQ